MKTTYNGITKKKIRDENYVHVYYVRDENYVHVYYASPDMDTYNGYGPTQFQLLIHNITSGEETKAVSEKIQKRYFFFLFKKKKKKKKTCHQKPK